MQQVVSLEYLRLIHGSMILDNIWTQFLGGDLYVGATYRRVYTVNVNLESTVILQTVQDKMYVRNRNRQWHMGFPLVPKSVTLNDLEQPNGRKLALFHPIQYRSIVGQFSQSG